MRRCAGKSDYFAWKVRGIFMARGGAGTTFRLCIVLRTASSMAAMPEARVICQSSTRPSDAMETLTMVCGFRPFN